MLKVGIGDQQAGVALGGDADAAAGIGIQEAGIAPDEMYLFGLVNKLFVLDSASKHAFIFIIMFHFHRCCSFMTRASKCA
jgi:hypothetical protein